MQKSSDKLSSVILLVTKTCRNEMFNAEKIFALIMHTTVKIYFNINFLFINK